MVRHRNKALIISTLFTLALLVSAQFVAATSRKDLLEQFCLSNQHNSGGFLDTPTGTTVEDESLPEFTSYANLFILSKIDPSLDILDNKLSTQSYLRDKFIQFSDVGVGDIPQVYYAYLAAQLVGANISQAMQEDGIRQLVGLQNQTTHGFGSFNQSFSSMADTYFAVDLLTTWSTDYQDNATFQEQIQAFIDNSWNDQEMAFASSPGGAVSLIENYYAIATLNALGILTAYNSTKREAVATYIESFYFDDPTYIAHYGGYGIKTGIIQTSLLYTFLATQTLHFLGANLHDETLPWVLSRQNSLDYGFYDVSPSSPVSSAKLSYYAVQTILLFDPEAFSGGVLNQQIWDLQSNPWAIAGIVVGTILVIGGGIYGLYKYRNRI